MALLETDDIIEEYYKEVKDKYPDISKEQFKAICKNPFNFFKLKIEDKNMPTIFIKYFGKFKVFDTRIKTLLKKLEHVYKFRKYSLDKKKPTMKEEDYKIRKDRMDNHYIKFKTFLLERLKIIQEHELDRRNKADNKKGKEAD